MHFRQRIYKYVHEYYSTQTSVRCGKMRFLLIFLLLAPCTLTAAFRIFGGEDAEYPTNSGGTPFFNRIGDWFHRTKERVYERLFGAVIPTPPPFTTELLDLDRFELHKRLRNHQTFELDLSTLNFDPDQDWGFRVGHWYFIRKAQEDQNASNDDFDEWNLQQRTTTTARSKNWNTPTYAIVYTNDELDLGPVEFTSTFSTTDEEPVYTVTQSMTEGPDTLPETTEVITESIDSFDDILTRTDKQVEDNETDRDFVYKGSAEVLME